MSKHTTGRFERSENGDQWETISPQDARKKLSGFYRSVDEVLAAMTSDGVTIRTPYAFYRFNRQAGGEGGDL